jgi:hypothetical protein
VAEADEKLTTATSTAQGRQEQPYAAPEGQRPPYSDEREPVAHGFTAAEPMVLLLTEYGKNLAEGFRAGILRSLEFSGDSRAEARARRSLFQLMLRYPEKPPGGLTRDDVRARYMRRYGIGKNSFDRLWAWGLDRSGVGWGKGGRPPGS